MKINIEKEQFAKLYKNFYSFKNTSKKQLIKYVFLETACTVITGNNRYHLYERKLKLISINILYFFSLYIPLNFIDL